MIHRGLTLLLVGLLAGCASLPPPRDRTATHAIPAASDSRLAIAVTPRTTEHPGVSGVYLLGQGRSAFAARDLLADAADRTLDVQYYIWHDDLSGNLLFDALLRAADRGVRVRLLLDDNNTAGMDPIFTALDAHPNLELRLYNPFRQRSLRTLGFLTEFGRLNRRMHNKSFTADNVATIIGGRNVGDEYFGAAEGVDFADLDMLAVGTVVGEVSDLFDRYWNSESAYPVTAIAKEPANEQAAAMLKERIEALGGATATEEYRRALENSDILTQLQGGVLPFEWVKATTVADDPAKTLAKKNHDVDPRMLPRMIAAIAPIETRFDLVSPYFVPMKNGTEVFANLARRGVHVRVLTNSLSATDVAPVHAGYIKRRKALLEAGVQLFELKTRAAPDSKSNDWVHGLGGSAASLHAKTFAVDSSRAFVGSFNFDPRSAELNTEMGFIVESPTLANALHGAFEKGIPVLAYEVRLDARKKLEWVDRSGPDERILKKEPESGAVKRGFVRFLSWLPIDWML